MGVRGGGNTWSHGVKKNESASNKLNLKNKKIKIGACLRIVGIYWKKIGGNLQNQNENENRNIKKKCKGGGDRYTMLYPSPHITQ